MSKKIEANNDSLSKGRTLNLDEIGDPGPVERVTENDIVTGQYELEVFMNEPVTVMVHKDTRPGSLDVVTVNVNGVNQNIIRGHNQNIKRKYLEALARTRTTVYRQNVRDANRPEAIDMKEDNELTYHFVVVEDQNPKGRPWLERILRAA